MIDGGSYFVDTTTRESLWTGGDTWTVVLFAIYSSPPFLPFLLLLVFLRNMQACNIDQTTSRLCGE